MSNDDGTATPDPLDTVPAEERQKIADGGPRFAPCERSARSFERSATPRFTGSRTGSHTSKASLPPAPRQPADASLEARAWETLYRRAAEFMATYPENYSDEEIAMRAALRAVDAARASRGEVGADRPDRPDASALAEVVAASAREPHADVVLHALHVSSGAAAVDAMRAKLHDGDPASKAEEPCCRWCHCYVRTEPCQAGCVAAIRPIKAL